MHAVMSSDHVLYGNTFLEVQARLARKQVVRKQVGDLFYICIMHAVNHSTGGGNTLYSAEVDDRSHKWPLCPLD